MAFNESKLMDPQTLMGPQMSLQMSKLMGPQMSPMTG